MRARTIALFLLAGFPAICAEDFRSLLARGAGVVTLPPGETRISEPLTIPAGAKNLTLRGDAQGSTIVMQPGFRGAAAIVARGAVELTLEGFAVVGDRTDLRSAWHLPLREANFADYYPANGILVQGARGLTIRNVRLRAIRTFPVLVSGGEDVHVLGVRIEDSGTLNPAGKNNTTGGILLEEGVKRFEVRDCQILRITGNGIWTHSYARSPRAADGWIAANRIESVARDAIQVGHATRVRVERNTGTKIGFPSDQIDFAGFGTPVALDTAGNVDESAYTGNDFTEVGGQCVNLDGFHDGEVRGNVCVNPLEYARFPGLHFGIAMGNHDAGMTSRNIRISDNTIQGFAYGGLFLIGTGHTVEGNRFLDLNLARCGSTPMPAACNYATDQPDMLRSGIYLGNNGGRPAATTGNTIRNNLLRGAGMDQHCVAAAPGIAEGANKVENNRCLPVMIAR